MCHPNKVSNWQASANRIWAPQSINETQSAQRGGRNIGAFTFLQCNEWFELKKTVFNEMKSIASLCWTNCESGRNSKRNANVWWKYQTEYGWQKLQQRLQMRIYYGGKKLEWKSEMQAIEKKAAFEVASNWNKFCNGSTKLSTDEKILQLRWHMKWNV